ncbi:MAG: peptidylprolyl isomerase [Elusimicrobia bacterium]|nr:peptidylprolyl isomerase [Elusimicrobiota bacterium]
MKKYVICMTALFALSGPVISAEVIDKTVALINGEHVLLSEYQKILNPIIEQYKLVTPKADQTDDKLKELKSKVLDQMIDDRLLLQEAKKLKIIVSKREVEEGIKQVKTRFKDEDEYKNELKKEGLSEEKFSKRIEEQLKQIKLIDSQIKSKLAVPSQESVKSLFNDVKTAMDGKEELKGKSDEDKKDIETLAKLIKRKYSELVRAKHILIRSSKEDSMVKQAAAKKKIEEVQAKLKAGDDFSELAKKYSEDTGSAENGGDLGYFGRGDMVKEFEDAAFALPVGETSSIVKTEFGYHIIQSEEKKAARKVAFDDLKNDLTDYLRQKEAEKKYADWIKDLRKKASVTISTPAE